MDKEDLEFEILPCYKCKESAHVVHINGEYFVRPNRITKCCGYKSPSLGRSYICRTDLCITKSEACKNWNNGDFDE